MASEPLEQFETTPARRWLRDNRARLVKFASVGVSGVFVNLAVFTVAFHILLAPVLSGHPLFVAANFLGFLVSVFTNFLLNDGWTWGDRRKGDRRQWLRRLAKYYITASGAGAVQIITASLTLVLFWTTVAPTVGGHDLAPTMSVLTGIAHGMVINFVASHVWAFRDAPPP